MTKVLVVAFATAALTFASECVLGPETRYGVVEVIATDPTGSVISAIDVELAPRNRGEKTVKSQSTRTRVLYGDYEVRVWAKGFNAGHRELRVFQPEVSVRMQLEVGYLGCPDPPADIGGRVVQDDGAGDCG